LRHARDLAALHLVEMGKNGTHRLARHLVGAGVSSEGGDAVAVLEIGVGIGAVAGPLGSKAVEDAGDDRFRADIGSGIREALGFDSLSIGGQSGQQVPAVLLR